MKKDFISMQMVLAVVVLLAGCSSGIKVTSDWNEDGKENLANKSVLIVARFNEPSARVSTERQIAEKLVEEGVDAKSSYKEFPALKRGDLTESEVKELRNVIQAAGYQAIVITSLKHIKNEQHTVQTGGYYFDDGFYDGYYGGFDSYYGGSYGDMYVPVERQTIETAIYSLETAAYNLEVPSEKQLFALITSNVTDPDTIRDVSEKYATKVVKKLIE